jgi:hypothetical protein
MGRIKRMHKGVRRLLVVVSIFFSSVYLVGGIVFLARGEEDYQNLLWIGLGVFVGFWVLVRAWLWIYDGFAESKKEKAARLTGSPEANTKTSLEKPIEGER